MDFLTKIKDLDNIIIDYKYQLEVNERKDKCMKELKGTIKNHDNTNFQYEYKYEDKDIINHIHRYGNKKYPYGYCYIYDDNILMIEEYENNECNYLRNDN